jgi:hypothetical protein
VRLHVVPQLLQHTDREAGVFTTSVRKKSERHTNVVVSNANMSNCREVGLEG